jgi:hypothetical protein
MWAGADVPLEALVHNKWVDIAMHRTAEGSWQTADDFEPE